MNHEEPPSTHYMSAENHRQLCDLLVNPPKIDVPSQYIDFVTKLDELCGTSAEADAIFKFFCASQDKLFNWPFLFETLRMYANIFRRTVTSTLKMSTDDILSCVVWIRMATKIARKNSSARNYFLTTTRFNTVDIAISAVTSNLNVELKGESFKLMAALAADENSAMQIWNILFRESASKSANESDRLAEIQADFENIECPLNTYDSSCGFLYLVRELFSHRQLPDVEVYAPVVHFVTKTIICQYQDRDYESVNQMWEMLTIGLDAIFNFLRVFYISGASMEKQSPHVSLFSQLLSDSELSRALIRILIDCYKSLNTNAVPLAKQRLCSTADAALRLLSYVVSVHKLIWESVGATPKDTCIYVASLESILLTPLPSAPQCNYVQLLNMFLDEHDILLPHTYYVIRILRKLIAKPSAEVHDALVRTFQLDIQHLRRVVSRLLSVASDAAAIVVSDQDRVSFDLADVGPERMRGEIARELLGLLIHAMELVPKRPNLTYLLFGYSVCDGPSAAEVTIQDYSCIESVLKIISTLNDHPEPRKAPFAALFEPASRLLLMLCDEGALSAKATLHFLRYTGNFNIIVALRQASGQSVPNDDYETFNTPRTSALSKSAVSYPTKANATFNNAAPSPTHTNANATFNNGASRPTPSNSTFNNAKFYKPPMSRSTNGYGMTNNPRLSQSACANSTFNTSASVNSTFNGPSGSRRIKPGGRWWENRVPKKPKMSTPPVKVAQLGHGVSSVIVTGPPLWQTPEDLKPF